MTDEQPSSGRLALTLALVGIAVITAWRVYWLWHSQVELFVDETQYWLWGEEPAFGYYSKPPLIGWIIGLSTTLAGSDAAFWIRLPSPLLYGVTAVLVTFAARTVWPPAAAAWAGLGFATLPGIGLLAAFISTDAPLLTCYALALLAMLRLPKSDGLGWAVALGVAIGVGLLAKYAMIYFAALLLVTWAVMPRMRPGWGRAAVVVGLAAAIFSPNILWNISNGFITYGHTAGNAGWAGIDWNWSGLAEFVGAQLAAFGPVLALTYLLALVRPMPALTPPARAVLILFSLTIFLGISGQALVRAAVANWAAPAFVAASVLVVPWLALKVRGWLGLSFLINGALTLVFAMAPAFPERAAVGSADPFRRALGVTELSDQVIVTAEAAGLTHIVSGDRQILADLVYNAKGRDVSVWAIPPRGVPRHHYAFSRPAPDTARPMLLVLRGELPASCTSAELLSTVAPERGAYRRDTITLWRVDGPCWPPSE